MIKKEKTKANLAAVAESVDDLAVITKQGFEGVDMRFEKVDKRLAKIEATMVTKDCLDDKLADLRGDLAMLIC